MSLENDYNVNHPQKLSLGVRIKNYLASPRGKKTIIIVLIILVIMGVCGYVIYKRYFYKDSQSANKNNSGLNINYEKKEEEKKEICKLDGTLKLAATANRHPLAVMIENHPEARPQSGIDQANIIYEAIAEGGITRFMAIFGPDAPEKIGPVRSARTFYLDWDLEYDAFYAHVGGNIDALDLIPKIGIKDLDQFTYGAEAYWREPKKGIATEHTMYASVPKLYDISKNNGWDVDKSNFTMLEFKNDPVKELRPASQTIKINFSSEKYAVTWNFHPEDNDYLRSMAGEIHKDSQSGNQLKAKNIIVQEVKRSPVVTRINEEGWEMTTIGEGKAQIFIDGKKIEGTWKKTDQDARTIFYDAEGNKIKFNPGVFWYEIVPPETVITSE